MILLAIETSPRIGSVALALADGALLERGLTAERGQARDLAGAIDALAKDASLSLGELTGVAVGLGPGGYTGMRLAVATARTLGYVLKVPVIGVPSSAALAASDSVPAGEIVVAQDARKGFLYFARYQKDAGGGLTEVDAPACVLLERVVESFADDAYVVGDGLPLLQAARGGEIKGSSIAFPKARDVLSLARPRFSRGEQGEETTLGPLYLRPSEAELLWQRRLREQSSGRGVS